MRAFNVFIVKLNSQPSLIVPPPLNSLVACAKYFPKVDLTHMIAYHIFAKIRMLYVHSRVYNSYINPTSGIAKLPRHLYIRVVVGRACRRGLNI